MISQSNWIHRWIWEGMISVERVFLISKWLHLIRGFQQDKEEHLVMKLWNISVKEIYPRNQSICDLMSKNESVYLEEKVDLKAADDLKIKCVNFSNINSRPTLMRTCWVGLFFLLTFRWLGFSLTWIIEMAWHFDDMNYWDDMNYLANIYK